MKKRLQEALAQCLENRIDHPDAALELGLKSLEEIQGHLPRFRKTEARFHYAIAAAYKRKNQPEEAIAHYRKQLGIANEIGDALIAADAKIGLATIAVERGDYSSTTFFLEDALSIQAKHKVYHNRAFSLHMLGIAQNELERNHESYETLKQSRELCAEYPENTRHLYPSVLVSLGIVLMDLGRLDEARALIEESIHVAQGLNSPVMIANAKSELARVTHAEKRYQEALSLLYEAEQEMRNFEYLYLIPGLLLYQGQFLSELQSPFYDIDLAREKLLRGLSEADQLSLRDWMLKIHRELSRVYERLGDDKRSLEHFKQYDTIKCEILDDSAQFQIQNLQVVSDLQFEQRKHVIEKAEKEALEEKNQKLEALLRERKELMGLAAHDLKNPLAGILGFVEYLKDHPCVQAHDDLPAIFELLESSATNAVEIISNILEDNRLEEGNITIKPERIDLCLMSREVVQLFENKAHAKSIELAFRQEPGECIRKIDRFLIRQALDNLLSNAIKFCKAGDHVEVAVIPQTDQNRIEICVSDDGPGISESDQKKLFKRFSRLSNKPTANEGSSGLGLSIVKKMVELNGGNVSCESKLGKGTTFRIQLPMDLAD